MQCPSCQFHNMPGSGHCARCGASLRLAAADINVHPPRASAWSRQLPTFWGLRRGWNRLRAALWGGIGRVFSASAGAVEGPPNLVGCIVPGWAQIKRGDRSIGWAYLWVYLGLLSAGVLMLGTFTGSILLGFAFTTHATAVVDGVASRFVTVADRVRLTAFTAISLFVLIYLPVGWALSQVATPLAVSGMMPPFEQGDILWYNRLVDPSLGDYVLYDVPETSLATHTTQGHAARLEIRGRRINRMVAKAGQNVAWQANQLMVDGVRCQWQPSGIASGVDGPVGIIPEGSVFIMPDNLIPVDVQASGGVLRNAGMVPASSVYGRLFFRSWPWSRMTFVH